MKAEIAIVAPSDWSITPEVLTIEVPPHAKSSKQITIKIPKDWQAPGPRFAIAADVMCDNRYLGQITEAVVEMKGAFA
jgi:hypothetical protein